jgi:hypothetical protein
MKYYCKHCGTEVIVSKATIELYDDWFPNCPVCLCDMKLIPDFETSAQWEDQKKEKLGG